MIGIPNITAATNAFNSETLSYTGSKFFDPDYATDPKNAKVLNLASAAIELNNIRQLYCSRFRWTSDNPNIPVGYIESMLFINGMLAFFEHKDYGWLLLPCAIKSYDVYGRPNSVTVMLPVANNPVIELQAPDFYLLRDNPADNVPFFTVQYYTRLIADTARSAEVYAKAMKKPFMVTGNFKNATTRKQFIRNIINNEQFVIFDKSLLDDMSDIDVVQNTSHNAQDLKGLSMYKTELYNECVAKLGITTPTTIKQAQVTEDEINKNDSMANIVLNASYQCRQEATKAIFEKAGISLTCELAPDLSGAVTDAIDPDNKPE